MASSIRPSGGLPSPWSASSTSLSGPQYVITDVDHNSDARLETVDVDGTGSTVLLDGGQSDNNYGIFINGLSEMTPAQAAAFMGNLFTDQGAFGVVVNALNGFFVIANAKHGTEGGIVFQPSIDVATMFAFLATAAHQNGNGLAIRATDGRDDGATATNGGDVYLGVGLGQHGGTDGNVKVINRAHPAGISGVTAGPFTVITSLTVTNGLITAITGT